MGGNTEVRRHEWEAGEGYRQGFYKAGEQYFECYNECLKLFLARLWCYGKSRFRLSGCHEIGTSRIHFLLQKHGFAGFCFQRSDSDRTTSPVSPVCPWHIVFLGCASVQKGRIIVPHCPASRLPEYKPRSLKPMSVKSFRHERRLCCLQSLLLPVMAPTAARDVMFPEHWVGQFTLFLGQIAATGAERFVGGISVFDGKARSTRRVSDALTRVGNIPTLSMDVENDSRQSILGSTGILIFLDALAHLLSESLLWMAPPCKTWSFMNSSKHERSRTQPMGHVLLPAVRQANAAADFVASAVRAATSQGE